MVREIDCRALAGEKIAQVAEERSGRALGEDLQRHATCLTFCHPVWPAVWQVLARGACICI